MNICGPKVPAEADLARVLQWTLDASNKFFSGLYRGGIWMTREYAKVVVPNGYKAVET